jgi:hypothetical protein
MAYYKFDSNAPRLDSASTLGDLQLAGNPSFPSSGPWSGTQYASPCVALTSDSDSSGGGQFLQLNPINLGSMSAAGGFSICSWFVYDQYTQNARIFEFGLGPNYNNVFLSRDSLSTSLRLLCLCGNTGQQGPSFYFPDPIQLGQWRHVCIVNKGAQWNFYDKGQLVGTQTSSCSLQDVMTTFNYIGRSDWSRADNRLLIGRVAEFRIYSRPLSASDVAAVYAYNGAVSSCLSPPSPPPRAPFPAPRSTFPSPDSYRTPQAFDTPVSRDQFKMKHYFDFPFTFEDYRQTYFLLSGF